MSEEPEAALEVQPTPDNSRASIRGRACPRCGGKIIPSDRAVYEDKADPTAIFPLWECERCGYAKMSEPPAPKKPAHAPAKKAAK
ncbi:MAG: hypothetical protein ABR554_07415 [Pyrinomonadaceae bacterium]